MCWATLKTGYLQMTVAVQWFEDPALYLYQYIHRRSCVQPAVHATQVLVQLDRPDHCQRGVRLRVPVHVATAVSQLQAQVGGSLAMVGYFQSKATHISQCSVILGSVNIKGVSLKMKSFYHLNIVNLMNLYLFIIIYCLGELLCTKPSTLS